MSGLCSDDDYLCVVHVGVSGIASKITLEIQAHNDGYSRNDVDQRCPDNGKCVTDSEECLKTNLDIGELVQSLNKSEVAAECISSTDAGRYLCEFIYYKSLHSTKGEALFIHVPDINKPYSSEVTAEAIKVVLEAICRQKGIKSQ